MAAGVICTRISKDGFKRQVGVDRQERRCRELAEKNRLPVSES